MMTTVVVQVRDAIYRDLPRILAIEQLAFPTPWSLKSFERELMLPFSRITVATLPNLDHGGAVGFLCRWLIADECHVLNLAVHPEFRRQGIGVYLLNSAVTEAKAKRINVITLEVRRTNVAARQLYRKLHFEERRLRRNYYGPGEDAIVMELTLA
jgi:[ribosomal protein S18]-alanine N-acetyltransferase